MDEDLENLISSKTQKKTVGNNIKLDNVLAEAKFQFLPLLSIAFFTLILLGSIVPNIQKIFSTIDQIDVLKQKDDQLNTRIKRFEDLRTQAKQMSDIINKINVIVPTGQSEVVKFRERISATATLNLVSLESSKSSETIKKVSQLESGNLAIIEIPSEFTITGGFDSFRNFLNGLYSGEDFFVVNKMNLNGISSQTQDKWNGDLDLVKYQFFTEPGFDPNLVYTQVSENDEPDASVINFLQTRFLKNAPQ